MIVADNKKTLTPVLKPIHFLHLGHLKLWLEITRPEVQDPKREAKTKSDKDKCLTISGNNPEKMIIKKYNNFSLLIEG